MFINMKSTPFSWFYVLFPPSGGINPGVNITNNQKNIKKDESTEMIWNLQWRPMTKTAEGQNKLKGHSIEVTKKSFFIFILRMWS